VLLAGRNPDLDSLSEKINLALDESDDGFATLLYAVILANRHRCLASWVGL
jgi:hypothetical protein